MSFTYFLTHIRKALKKEKLYNIKTIKYEDFVEYIEDRLIELSSFLNLECNDEVLNNNGIIVQEYFENKRTFTGKKADKTRMEKRFI